jgi:hypothetical protein
MAHLIHTLILPIVILAMQGGNPEENITPNSDGNASVIIDSAITAVTSAPLDTPLSPIDTITLSNKIMEPIVDSSWWSRAIPNKAFGVGEKLEFSIKYGSISAGKAVMEVADTIIFDNHSCFRIVSIANSSDFISIFYKVRDTVQTIVDVPGLFPRYFTKQLREGKYKVNRQTKFDQKRHLAITGNDTIPTFAFVQDPLSSLYYIRTQEFVPGIDIMIDSHSDKKNYPLKVRVLGKERIEVPAGKFDCIIIEPIMRSEGIFKAKGNIRIWITDDQYKMPVMMKSEVYFLGSINAQLSKYTRGKIANE